MQKVILDQNDYVQNIIEYDEQSAFSLPAGFTLVDFGPNAMIGGTYQNGVFAPRPSPLTSDLPPSVDDQIASLQAAVQSLTMQVLTMTMPSGV